jgi:type I restriction-modification system DNA methylase subunit
LINGAIYTPKNIREYITEQSFLTLGNKNIHDIKVVDIACGCGGFLSSVMYSRIFFGV